MGWFPENDNFNTDLGKLETAYQIWRQANMRPAEEQQNYDLKGYYLNALANNPEGLNLSEGHLTDQFKKPNHPTFSEDSQYSSPEHPGGAWSQIGDKWLFVPTQHNLANIGGVENMRNYFDRAETDPRTGSRMSHFAFGDK